MLMSVESGPSLKLVHVGSETRSLAQIIVNIVYTQEGTVLIQSLSETLCTEYRTGMKLVHTSSTTRSIGQILEKPCE